MAPLIGSLKPIIQRKPKTKMGYDMFKYIRGRTKIHNMVFGGIGGWVSNCSKCGRDLEELVASFISI